MANDFQTPAEILLKNQKTADFKSQKTNCINCGQEFESVQGVFRRRLCRACQLKWEEEENQRQAEELRKAIEDKKNAWRNNSGIPPTLISKTFDNFDEKMAPATVKLAREWADGFNIDNPRGYPSLIFYSGSPGVGKTHLMIAIANAVIERWQGDPQKSSFRPIRFESGPGLVRRIRSTFNLPMGETNHEREEDVYNELKGVKLLLLDDVGKEKPGQFTRETYWFIIDERMKSGLPVLITSRIPLESGKGTLEDLMGEDTVDRLFGMIQGKNFIHMKGTSYRRKERQV